MSSAQFTGLLIDSSRGDKASFKKLMPIVYAELRRLARQYLRRERKGNTLQTTGLVHEAYLKLIGGVDIQWQGRAHFFRAAAQAMRRILVDHARSRQAAKRDAGERVTLTEDLGAASDSNLDVLALDQALEALSRLDERKGAIVELRYFAGLSVEATGEALGISPATVKREWVLAKGWLYNELSAK
jgi:RNA polymerase sigma factor (TIGR02999 family)